MQLQQPARAAQRHTGWDGTLGPCGERCGTGKYVYSNPYFVYEGSYGADGRKNGE